MSLSNIDNASKKENDKKSRSMVATRAGVWCAKNIWYLFVNYTMQVLSGSGSPTEFILQWFFTTADWSISEYARAEKKSGE